METACSMPVAEEHFQFAGLSFLKFLDIWEISTGMSSLYSSPGDSSRQGNSREKVIFPTLEFKR